MILQFQQFAVAWPVFGAPLGHGTRVPWARNRCPGVPDPPIGPFNTSTTSTTTSMIVARGWS
eukprot:3219337-Rhodomonas_salina.1